MRVMPAAAKVLATRLRQIRGERSMAEMAELVGVSRQTWFRWERGDAFPDPDNLDEIASKNGVPVSDLFEVA